MRQKLGAVLSVIAVIVGVTPVVGPPRPASTSDLLFDGFDGTALDTSKWAIVEHNGNIDVTGGNLVTYGGVHKRVDTVMAFGQVSTEARIRFVATGTPNYMKFGFEVNAVVESPGLPGFYFDTLEPAAGGGTGYVFALAYDASHGTLLKQKIALGCENYHVYRIDWTTAEVRFSIDDTLRASVAYSYSGNLSVGIWNDRAESMKTDWVRVFSDTSVLRADAGGPYSDAEGHSIEFDASGSSDPEGDSLTYRWDFNGDGTWDTAPSSNPKSSHAYPDDFVGVAAVEASDGVSVFADETCVSVANAPPIPQLDASPSPPVLGAPVTFSGFFDDPGIADVHTAGWSFGDGTTAPGTFSPGVGASHHIMDPVQHTYSTQGTYVTTLTVCDDEGACRDANRTLTFLNTPPTADAGPDIPSNEGDAVPFSGSVSDPDVGDNHTFAWDFGDGSGTSGTLTPSHVYADNGAYNATLTVCDAAGACSTDAVLVTVANVVPDLDVGSDVRSEEGSVVLLRAVITDPGFDWAPTGTREDFVGQVDWGDGSIGSDPIVRTPGAPGTPTFGVLTGTHTYADDGTYTVTARVCDDDGGCSTEALLVLVQNVAPTVSAMDDLVAMEGGNVTFSASATDPGFDSPTAGTAEDFVATVDWGEGTAENVPVVEVPGSPGVRTLVLLSTMSHQYGDDGDYAVVVLVCDDDGGCGTSSFTAKVTNLPPALVSLSASVTSEVVLRVAGEKWHDVSMELYFGGVLLGSANVTRLPGSPDEQAANLGTFTLTLSAPLTARIVYTPLDDPVNGEWWGADPVWVVFRYPNGSESRVHHTFNVRHPETWVWEPDLTVALVSMGVVFTATAVDAGSDDLIFTWDFGDGLSFVRAHYNDGLAPDPPRSPGGVFPFSAKDIATHVFGIRGWVTVNVVVSDDDGGSVSASVTIFLGT